MKLMSTKITSANNPRFKAYTKLRSSRERQRSGLFGVEGTREISLACQADYGLQAIIQCPELLSQSAVNLVRRFEHRAENIFEVKPTLFEKLVLRKSSDGVVFIFHCHQDPLETLETRLPNLIVVGDSIEKPGNTGALLRSLDACENAALVLTGKGHDSFNPNLIRASLGARFSVPTVHAEKEDCLNFFRKHNIPLVAITQSSLSEDYASFSYPCPVAVVLGSEAHGIDKIWLTAAKRHVEIPMCGQVDSLNVATAGAVIIFEAQRQWRLGLE